MHRYVHLRLGESAADDIAAETFLRAFRDRARYDLAHPHARAWLYGIASNLVTGHGRRGPQVSGPGQGRRGHPRRKS
ncbi:sigma factor [Nonomuraea wenchangensis]